MPAQIEDVKRTIRDYLAEIGVFEEDIADDAELDELDIDSIDVVNILVELEELYNANIKRTEVAEMTLEKLAALVVERSGLAPAEAH